MFHNSEMYISRDTFSPYIEVPNREYIEFVPGVACYGGGSVSVIFENKLSSKYVDMPHYFGVAGLVGDIKC